MHKMLKLYFDEHVDFGNKDLELQKNKEYIDNEKKYEEIKNEIYGLSWLPWRRRWCWELPNLPAALWKPAHGA